MSATTTETLATKRPPPIAYEWVQLTLLGVLAVFPWVPGTQDLLGMGGQAAIFTLIGASLVLLTGWVGQISLGHAALVGVGGYATGWAAGALGLVFPLSLPIAAAFGALVAAALGVVALRVRGLYLAVATLIFSWAASQFLFRQDWVTEHGAIPGQVLGTEGAIPYLDFVSRRTFYYIAWIVAVAVLYALVNLRDSRSGRALFAVRGSEMAAASLGMDVLRYKVLAFALSGTIAGIAGNLMMVKGQSVSPASFEFEDSLFFLAIAVVGGLVSLAGAVTAGWLFAGLEELFFQVAWLNPYLTLVGAALLAVVFRIYPGGLASLGTALLGRLRTAGRRLATAPQRAAERITPDADAEEPGAVEPGAVEREDRPRWRVRLLRRAWRAVRRAIARRLTARARRRGLAADDDAGAFLDLDLARTAEVHGFSTNGDGPAANGDQPADSHALARARLIERGAARAPLAADRDQRPALIEASHVTKRFGGLTAVDDANLTVREGEICGLIGPNGAGKTTLFNAIAGFHAPTEGSVHLYGQDVTGMPVHQRAQLGVARTFQIIQLFSELTVFDNLLAATHLQNPTGFIQHMAVTQQALVAEATARDRVQTVVELLGLEEVAPRPVAGLPFGTLRMVEVARALVTGARVIMLDEPASGLDEHETDALSEVLRVVRGIGATLLLIEHDVRMVTSVTDYLYVLDRGQIIAQGPPAQIKDDPAVITAYIGGATDTEAGPDDRAAPDQPDEPDEPDRTAVIRRRVVRPDHDEVDDTVEVR